MPPTEMSAGVRVAVITVSDGVSAGTRVDTGGDLAAERMEALPADIISRAVVPDSVPDIRQSLVAAIAVADCVVLTGGTGVGPRDVTPQAVVPLLDYEVPGMAEAMRSDGLRHTPHAMLSRQIVGVAQGRLIIALPGSPRAVADCIDSIWAALPHALGLLRGDSAHPPEAGHDGER